MASILNVDQINNASGTSALSIDSSGVITQPNKPMFAATGVSNTALSNGVWTKATFNNETFDVGGYYDPTTNYRYTPLIAGKYFFNAHAYVTYASVNPLSVGVSLAKNGTNVLFTIIGGSAPTYGSVNVTGVLDMNGSTDYVEVYVYQSGSTNGVYYVNATYGNFTGYLIG